MEPDETTTQVDRHQVAPVDPNAALAKLLQAELAAHEAQPAAAPGAEPVFFGMTMTALFIGFVLSVVGLAMANYGRKTSNVVVCVVGVVMMVVPFFVTSTAWLLVAGGILIGVPVVMKKLQLI